MFRLTIFSAKANISLYSKVIKPLSVASNASHMSSSSSNSSSSRSNYRNSSINGVISRISGNNSLIYRHEQNHFYHTTAHSSQLFEEFFDPKMKANEGE